MVLISYNRVLSPTFSRRSRKFNMVNVLKGVLIECDPAVKQFLLHLDDKNILGQKFILEDLDETHLFISADIVPILKEKVWELMDSNSFNVTQLS